MIVEGKRILITGGTSGIGLATAHVLAKKGAKVFITGRRTELLQDALESLRAAGVAAHGTTADVATERGRQVTIKSCLEALGSFDILINNAGVSEPAAWKTRQRPRLRQCLQLTCRPRSC